MPQRHGHAQITIEQFFIELINDLEKLKLLIIKYVYRSHNHKLIIDCLIIILRRMFKKIVNSDYMKKVNA